MKSRKAVCLLVLFCVASCITMSCNKGNGILVTKEINIGDYDEINVSGAATVDYQQVDAPPYLQFKIDENMEKHVDIYVKGKILYISLKGKSTIGVKPTNYIIATNSRTINNIKTSGSVKVNLLSDVETDYLGFDLSGSTTIIANEPLIVNTLKTRISGSGNVSINGEAKTCVLNISGSGKMKALNFSTKHLDCNISGSGNVEIHVIESIDCKISGSGTITYSGNPSTINQNISGSGKLIKK